MAFIAGVYVVRRWGVGGAEWLLWASAVVELMGRKRAIPGVLEKRPLERIVDGHYIFVGTGCQQIGVDFLADQQGEAEERGCSHGCVERLRGTGL